MAQQWPGTPLDGEEQWPGTLIDGNTSGEPEPNATLGRYAEGFLGGANRGIAGLLGAPVDLVNAGLGMAGYGSEYPIGGSQSISDAMDATLGRLKTDQTMFTRGPDTTTGRILHRTGRELGATVIPGAGLIGAGMRTVAPAVKQAPTLARTFLEPIGRSPGRAVAGEAVSAAGAGLAAGVAQEAAPGNVAFEMGAQLVGGLTPAYVANSLPAQAAKLGHKALKRVSPEAQQRAARETVRGHVEDQLSSTRAREELERSGQVMQEVPGFQPSLAERAGSPGLVKVQEDIESKLSGMDLDAAVARGVANEDAIRGYARQQAPTASAGPSFVVDTARRRVDDLRGRIDDEAERITDARYSLAGRLPQVDVAGEGARLRSVLQDKLGDEQATWTMVASESGLNDPNFIVPFAGFKTSLVEAFNSASTFSTKSGKRVTADPSVLRVVMDADDAQSFPGLMELRADISAAIRQTERMPSVDDAQRRGLRGMKAAFDGALESAVQATGDPDIVRRYGDFRRGYREQFVEPFKQRASHDVLHRDSTGAYVLPDESVVKAYFQPGGVSAARQFKTVFGNDLPANAALEAVALDSLRNAAVRNGTLDPRAFAIWRRQHEGVLAEFPYIAAKVGDFASTDRALRQRQQTLTHRARSVEDALLGRELKAIAADTRNPEEMIARAIQSPRKMGQIAGRLRNSPEAKAALQRAVWDQTVDLPPGDLATFINTHQGALRVAGITPEHMQALRMIDAARSIMTRVPLPKGSAAVPSSPEVFARMFGVRPDMLANRLHHFQSGRTEKTWLITNLLSNIMSRKAVQNMDDAYRVVLYDPKAAEALSKAIVAGGEGPYAKQLGARLFALGVTPFADDEQQGEWPGQTVQ